MFSVFIVYSGPSWDDSAESLVTYIGGAGTLCFRKPNSLRSGLTFNLHTQSSLALPQSTHA